jgi:O-antigen/teichoic acid export membrane protein
LPSIGDHIRRNTRVMIFSWGMNQAIQLVRMPILIAYLATAGFGLWQLAFTVMSFMAIYSVGFDNAYIKYVGEYNAKGDHKGLSHLLSTGVAVAWILGAFIFAVVCLFADTIVDLMMNKNEDIVRLQEAWFVIIMVTGINWFKMVMGVHQALLTGLQRLDLVNYVFIVSGPIELVVMIAVVSNGFGVRGLAVVYAVFMALGLFVMLIINRRLTPAIRVNPFLAQRRFIWPLFSLGGRMQLLGLVAIIAVSVDPLSINKTLGLAIAGVYGVSRRLSQRAQSLAQQGFGALVPASADLHGREDYDHLKRIYTSAVRLSLIMGAFVYAFLAVNADFVSMAFLGEENLEYMDLAVFALRAFCAARIFHTLTGPGSSMLRGAGKPFKEIAYQIIAIAIFACLFLYAWRSGNQPLMIQSYPIAIGIGSFIFLVLANRYFKAPTFCPFDLTLLPAFITLGVAWGMRALWDASPVDLAAAFIGWLPIGLEDERWPSFVAIGLLGSVYTVIYTIVIFALPGLSAKEKDQLLRFIPYGQRIAARLTAAKE